MKIQIEAIQLRMIVSLLVTFITFAIQVIIYKHNNISSSFGTKPKTDKKHGKHEISKEFEQKNELSSTPPNKRKHIRKILITFALPIFLGVVSGLITNMVWPLISDYFRKVDPGNDSDPIWPPTDRYVYNSELTIDDYFSQNKSYSVGDHFLLGFYEQDNNVKNNSEFIEWRILAIDENDYALAISEYGLSYEQFNSTGSDVSWEGSTLRRWLNNEFIYACFTENERNEIQLCKNTNNENPVYPYTGSDSTDDKIFCLSIDELEDYFRPTYERVCIPTEYASRHCVNGTPEPDGDHWWLRTAGSSLNAYTTVRGYGTVGRSAGSVNYEGTPNDIGGVLVRPAFWIKINTQEQNSKE